MLGPAKPLSGDSSSAKTAGDGAIRSIAAIANAKKEISDRAGSKEKFEGANPENAAAAGGGFGKTKIIATGSWNHLPGDIRDLYQKYADSGPKQPGDKQDKEQENGVVEMERQKRQLSQQLKTLKHSSSQQMEMGMKNNVRKIGENSMLMTELNDVRKWNKQLGDRVKLLEQQLKTAETSANDYKKELAALNATGTGSLAGTHTGNRTPVSRAGGNMSDVEGAKSATPALGAGLQEGAHNQAGRISTGTRFKNLSKGSAYSVPCFP